MCDYRLFEGDCLEILPRLVDEGVRVDCVLTDPPYGTIKGLNLDGWNNQSTEWDTELPLEKTIKKIDKLLKPSKKLILFSQEPYTNNIRNNRIYPFEFSYPYYWLKDHFANPLGCKKAPVSYIEDISVFNKKYDTTNMHPLRKYSQQLLKEMNMTYKEIEKDLGHRRAEHFFYRNDSSQFSICTNKTYNELIDTYHINKLDCFKPYDELKKINDDFNGFVFNVDGNFKSNVLEYKKPYNNNHPTEKPVPLLEDLIKTYTNKGDTVLDFTMGSGSTGVAAANTGRKFIGIEIEHKYYKIAEKRIREAYNQTRLI